MSADPARIPSVGEIVRGPALEPFPEESVGALIADRASKFGSREAVRARGADGQWRSLTFAQLDERRRGIAAAFLAEPIAPGDRVLVLAANSVEMLLCELALLSLGAVSTPIFPDYPLELLRHCLRDSGARVALAGSAQQQARLAEVSGGQLERVVLLSGEAMPGDDRGVALAALEARHAALGAKQRDSALAEVDARTAAVGAGERAFLLYTSGTTGRPKGVPLSHRNVLSQQAAIARTWSLSADDVFLAYLPWHHCFGALFERLMALWHGAVLVLDDSRGRDLDRLLANFREVQPTLYLSVPRVYQGLVGRARQDPSVKAALLHPRLRFVFTAAAPLPEGCYRFFKESNIPVHEGWGLTETSPDATLTGAGERCAGATGWPLPGTEVLLEPVEEASEGSGEVLVRGPQVTSGYHGDPEATGRVLRADGFFRTGDLGSWTAHGLRIGGRVDGVFKLQNGEKVSSGEVEAQLLAATPLLEQAVVLGPGQPFATALLWLNAAAARAFAQELGLAPDEMERSDAPLRDFTLEELTQLPELRRALTEALQAANLLQTVHYQRVRRAALVAEPLTIDRGQLTPTQKIVRRAVAAQHAALVDALRSEAPHAALLELHRKGDAFHHA